MMNSRVAMLLLLLSAVTESCWNVCLKKAVSFTDWKIMGPGILFMIAGIIMFKTSLRIIPLGVAVMIWSGVSLVLTIGLDVLYLKTKIDWLTAVFMVMCMVSILGLNYASGR